MSQTASDIARELDRFGVVPINMIDPIDKSPVAAIRLADAAILLGVNRAQSAVEENTAHACPFCEDVHLPRLAARQGDTDGPND